MKSDNYAEKSIGCKFFRFRTCEFIEDLITANWAKGSYDFHEVGIINVPIYTDNARHFGPRISMKANESKWPTCTDANLLIE